MNKKINSIITKIKGDSLIANFSVLFSGTAVAQIISFVLSPILTRLYTPSDFGVNSIYNSLLLIGAVFCTLRFQTPIAMSDNVKERKHLTDLSLSTSMLFAIFAFIITFVFKKQVGALLGVETNNWFWILPISMFLIGSYETFFQILLSEQKYKDMTLVSIIKVGTMGLMQIIFSVVNLSYLGLILGNLISYAVVVIYMMYKTNYVFRNVKINIILNTFKKYIEYPKYAFPAELLSISSTQLLPIMIAFLFTPEITGYYSLANRLIAVPISIIGNSLRQVYLKEASIEYNETNNVYQTFRKTSLLLICIALPIGVVLYFIAPWFFKIFFGQEWEISGIYLKMLIPVFLARFVVTPVMATIYIIGKSKLGLIVNGLLMIISLVLTFIFDILSMSSPNSFLITYSLSYFAIYLMIYIYFWYTISSKRRQKL